MNDRIELPKAQFVRLVESVMQSAGCSSFLPGEVPPPDWIEPDPEACKHWTELVTVIKAADAAIERVAVQQRVADAVEAGGSERIRESNRSELMQFVDDFCGTPPRWPVPWPRPRFSLDPGGLRAADLLVAAGRFHAAAESFGGDVLRADLAAAADRLFEAGLARLS